jgi:hypothetical protein
VLVVFAFGRADGITGGAALAKGFFIGRKGTPEVRLLGNPLARTFGKVFVPVVRIVIASVATGVAHLRTGHLGPLVSMAAVHWIGGKPIAVATGNALGQKGWIVATERVGTNLRYAAQGRHQRRSD